ncbi:hypothetical protein PCANC_10529 [Puccinia coronata f. sp. avenae]|uniref:Uncharacterized protein n=1 Tax=Puccinia coronata f. sp. avenae TaxID=200324 RepID=A0A2N5SGA1_9BASI|nr:hypothetical protein PCASD_23042 [Puccinia coronata f. sp. avenae]PLW43616.1 hypothetical protein PCASD_11417 [Puccinia coronata f. sp. avenae]PLW55261.1 hypothetical protein PCANC_10529 [Puccinia coronata f. sp. avenae]
MQTVDEGKLFQSDAQLNLAEGRRLKSLADHRPTAENGYPIILPSKPLQLVIEGDDAFVAQNGFVAQRICLKSGKVKATFRGHAGPVTSLALYTHTTNTTPTQKRKILFTGSWDKTIKTWDIETQVLLSTSTGHVDFVKSIHIIPTLGILVSGSTDRDVRLWDIKQSIESYNWEEIDAEYQVRKKAKMEANRTKTQQEIAAEDAIEDAPAGLPAFNSPSLNTRVNWPGPMYDSPACVGILKSHTRPIDSINSYPTVCETEEETHSLRKNRRLPHLLLSADSMGTLKVWLVPADLHITKAVLDCTSWPHKTTINDIQIGCEIRHDIDHQTSAQLWTASADNSVLHSTLHLLPSSTHRLVNVLRIEQPYFIRSVLNLPLFFAHSTHSESAFPNWLITGSTDEDIRIYDLESIEDQVNSSAAPRGSQPLRKPDRATTTSLRTVSNGWFATLQAHWHEVNCVKIWIDSHSKKPWLVSSGLDGTLRKWEVSYLQTRFVSRSAPPSVATHTTTPQSDKHPQFKLTAEEEAALAEIMSDMK